MRRRYRRTTTSGFTRASPAAPAQQDTSGNDSRMVGHALPRLYGEPGGAGACTSQHATMRAHPTRRGPRSTSGFMQHAQRACSQQRVHNPTPPMTMQEWGGRVERWIGVERSKRSWVATRQDVDPDPVYGMAQVRHQHQPARETREHESRCRRRIRAGTVLVNERVQWHHSSPKGQPRGQSP